MKRINVVGTSASGKTTFSRKLAERLNLTHIELDNLLWLDDWQETPDFEFFQKIEQAIAFADMDPTKQGYVIDGNYSRTTHLTWKASDTVIWLDLPFYLNLFQSLHRAFGRALSQKPFWENSNNTESFSRMFTRDSIVLWMIKTYKKNRKKYIDKMNDPQFAHVQFIHITTRKQMRQFLENLK
ncbi:MAG: adenylate kinase [Acinetobacter sp.]